MLDRIMRWDRDGRLHAEAIQSESGQRLLAEIPPEKRLDSWHLVDASGRVRSAGAAAPPLFRLLPGGFVLAAALAAVPALTELGYRWVAANRELLGRFFSIALALLMVGCGSTVQADSQLTVHASLPLEGAEAPEGRDALAGAKLALEQSGGEAGGAAVVLDVASDVAGSGPGAGWTQAQIAANARDATEDSTTIAYLGELSSNATRISVPITNDAEVPQISPGPVSELLLRAPGSNDPPEQFQTTGERTLIAFRERGAAAFAPSEQFVADYEAATGREANESAALGYESMALTLDAINRADDPLDRSSVLGALLATENRDSILGTYSISADGLATLP